MTIKQLIDNLNDCVIRAGGSGYDELKLSKITALELLDLFAPNGIRFEYGPVRLNRYCFSHDSVSVDILARDEDRAREIFLKHCLDCGYEVDNNYSITVIKNYVEGISLSNVIEKMAREDICKKINSLGVKTIDGLIHEMVRQGLTITKVMK